MNINDASITAVLEALKDDAIRRIAVRELAERYGKDTHFGISFVDCDMVAEASRRGELRMLLEVANEVMVEKCPPGMDVSRVRTLHLHSDGPGTTTGPGVRALYVIHTPKEATGG